MPTPKDRIERLERRMARLRRIAEVAETPLSARILKVVERMDELARQVEDEHTHAGER